MPKPRSHWLTTHEVAAQLGLSVRRVQALAKARHHLGIGWQVPGTKTWLFRPEEVDLLRPGKPGRPKESRPQPR